MLFATDSESTCSFLWVRDEPEFLYAVVPASSSALETLINQLRTEVTAGLADVTRAPDKRDNSGAFPVVAESGQTRGALIAKGEARSALERVMFPAGLHEALRKVRSLSIVSVRGMSTLPIAMLRPFGDELVVERFAVSFIVFLPDIRTAPSTWTARFAAPLIVGDPDATQDPEWVFKRLPGAQKEAKAAFEIYKGRLLLGAEATLSAYRSASESADLIYLAAHGLSSATEPMTGGFVALSAGDRLTARQVMDAEFHNAPIVVLSACQTATGLNIFSGVVGLARAFHKAGARSTVMSLWSVEDRATLELMTSLQKHLLDRAPPEALRAAMQEVRLQHPDPGKWAAFNVFGNAYATRP